MKNVCKRYNCIECCLETQMPLLKEDIKRIIALGFNYDYFIINKNNWLQLKNYGGRCVFNDGEKCLIYEDRPEGCKLYPIIYDEDECCAVLDEYCKYRGWFEISKNDCRTLFALIRKLKDEREKRLKFVPYTH